MSTENYDRFYEVFSAIELVADNGGIASLDDQEAQALVQTVHDLALHTERIIEVYDHYWDIQEIGGQPLEEAIEAARAVLDKIA